MIHQVQKSAQDFQNLKQIIKLQIELLKLAVEEEQLTVSENGNLGNIELRLRDFYSDNVTAEKTAKWITGKTSTLLEPLRRFASHTDRKAKNSLVEQVIADINLLYRPKSGKLQAQFTSPKRGETATWEQAVGLFMGTFYELFGQRHEKKSVIEYGFPNYLFTRPINEQFYSRYEFIDSFTAINGALYLCAICDATAYRTTVDSRAYTSIEHFFPKSTYPHLCIHPYNLIPICTYCNSGSARDKDPMDVVADISEILLPYRRDRGLRETSYINLDLQVRPQEPVSNEQEGEAGTIDLSPHKLSLKAAKGHDSVSRKIYSFDNMYRITERWNEEYDQINEHTIRRIQHFLLSDIQNGSDLSDKAYLKDRLLLLMAFISQRSLGKDPYGFATIWMLKYFIDSIDKPNPKSSYKPVPESSYGEMSPIHYTLFVWAQTQQERWKGYRETARKLIERVPQEAE